MLVTLVTEVSHVVSRLPHSWRSRDRLYKHSLSLLDVRPFPAPSAHGSKRGANKDGTLQATDCRRHSLAFCDEKPMRVTVCSHFVLRHLPS